MLMADIAFLSKEEVLLLFNDEEENVTSIAVYSLLQQQAFGKCHFPFPDRAFQAEFLTRPESLFGEHCPSTTRSIVPDPELNIITVSIRIEELRPALFCVISVQRFLQVYNSLLGRSQDRDKFEWAEWGPEITRWLPYASLEPTGSRNSFGSLMLAWGSAYLLDSETYTGPNIVLLDFNPWPIKRGATTKLEEQCHQIVIQEETQWIHPRTGTVLKSRLPYRAFVRPWLPPCYGFRFDGSTVVGRRVCLSLTTSIIPCLIFLEFEGNEEWFYSFLPLKTAEELKGEQEVDNIP
jgi:hypothetical protein